MACSLAFIRQPKLKEGIMKARTLTSLTIGILLLMISGIYAQVPSDSADAVKYSIAQTNPLAGAKSTNDEIRFTSVYNLGEIKSDDALFTLMKVLRGDPNESIRIVAALSLIKQGDARGVYFVKRSAKFNDMDKVGKFCKKFHNAYLVAEYMAKHNIKNTTGSEYIASTEKNK